MSRSEENLLWTEIKKGAHVGVLIGCEQKSLPKNGWIHPCYFCSVPTSRVVRLKYNHKLYYVFRCKECVKYTLGEYKNG